MQMHRILRSVVTKCFFAGEAIGLSTEIKSMSLKIEQLLSRVNRIEVLLAQPHVLHNSTVWLELVFVMVIFSWS